MDLREANLKADLTLKATLYPTIPLRFIYLYVLFYVLGDSKCRVLHGSLSINVPDEDVHVDTGSTLV